jgi:hypothetical protein
MEGQDFVLAVSTLSQPYGESSPKIRLVVEQFIARLAMTDVICVSCVRNSLDFVDTIPSYM